MLSIVLICNADQLSVFGIFFVNVYFIMFRFQDLHTLITKLLDKANQCGMTSIAIPAIGTGNLGYPRDVTARVMYEAAIQFSKTNPGGSVNDIRFWVYDKDLPTVQVIIQYVL